jgi:16S rRNA (uracil1498-N3)-methyltransferase
MTRRRWIADEVFGNRATLVGDHADHLVRVLRAQVGQEFEIATGDGVRLGRVLSAREGRVEFELGEEVPSAKSADITLLLAIFKFDRMEWAIEKCTELGVERIVPVIARRTDVHLAAAALKREERWRRLVLHAAEQSRRAAPPEIAPPVALKEAVARAVGLRIVLAETERQTLVRDAVRSLRTGGPVVLALGPEGGWADEELKLFEESGFVAASLGPAILRAETAAIAATAIVLSELS